MKESDKKRLPPWLALMMEEAETEEGRERQAKRFSGWAEEQETLERARRDGKVVIDPFDPDDILNWPKVN